MRTPVCDVCGDSVDRTESVARFDIAVAEVQGLRALAEEMYWESLDKMEDSFLDRHVGCCPKHQEVLFPGADYDPSVPYMLNGISISFSVAEDIFAKAVHVIIKPDLS